MHTLSKSTIAICLVSAMAYAQTGPGIIRSPAKSTILTAGSGGQVPATTIQQVSFMRVPGDAAGTWTCCLTVSGLDSTWGGVGSGDVLLGKYDTLTGKFTPTTDAAALNTTGYEFGLMIDPTGRYAVVDHPDGVYFGSRTTPSGAFSNVVKVSGVTATYVDPSLGYVGGTLMMFWAESNGIEMQQLDITTLTAPKLVGTKTTVSKSAKGGTANSPTPVIGNDGDVEGLWLADLSSNDNDMVWAGDLDPSTATELVVDTGNWINNGGVAGSTLAWADDAGGYHVKDAVTAWLVGDVEQIAGTADFTGAAPTNGGKTTMIDVLFLAAKPAAPLPIPGFAGALGLELATFTVFASTTHSGAEDLWAISFGIPNDAALSGLRLAAQAASFDAGLTTLALSSTTFLVIQ